MLINGTLSLRALPNHYIVQLTDGSYKMFFITPFRNLTDDDLTPYLGHNPRRCNGIPLPDYQYNLYGLEKSEESMTEKIFVRLTPTTHKSLQEKAAKNGENVSDYVRNLIARDLRKE